VAEKVKSEFMDKIIIGPAKDSDYTSARIVY